MQRNGVFHSAQHGAVEVLRGHYAGPAGPVAVVLMQDGELLTTLSVNMYRPQCSRDSHDLPADCFYVKEWGENEDVAREALACGLFLLRSDLPRAESGFVSAGVWQIR